VPPAGASGCAQPRYGARKYLRQSPMQMPVAFVVRADPTDTTPAFGAGASWDIDHAWLRLREPSTGLGLPVAQVRRYHEPDSEFKQILTTVLVVPLLAASSDM
jgi:hypothetical protein